MDAGGVDMKTVVIAIATLALLGPALAGAQSSAPQTPPAAQTPPAPATPPPAPGSPSTPAPDPAQPRTQAPGTPGAPAPRAPDAPADRAPGEGRIFGLSPLVAVIFGLIILGVIIALMASRRRDDVVVDTRIDTPLPPERPLGTTESEIERERRRRAS
jgi:hypothetical protein